MLLPLSIPSPNSDWTSFTVGPFTIRAYAICILVGIALALWITGARLKRRGVEAGVAIDVAIYAVPLGIIFARAYHVLTHPADYFYEGADIWAIFRVWDGGIAIFGAMIGGVIGIWVATRISGLRFSTFVDALAPGMLVAQAVGRIGNWFNSELFGLPTNLPWGLQVSSDNPAFPHGLPASTLFHPLFLYELIWNLLGAAVLAYASKRWVLQWGRTFALYAVWYGVGRFFLEGIRIDPSQLVLGIQFNQLAAGVFAVFGVVLFIYLTRRHTGLEPSPYRPGREPKVAPAASGDGDEKATSEADNASHVQSDDASALQNVSAATSSSKPADKA